MKARISGIDMYYEVSGQGPWITLSHSLAAHSGMWDAQLPTLEKHFTVLRYDIRGHGQTQATDGPYTLAQLAGDIHALLKHLGVARTHWLGLSLGGMIGQTLAIDQPQLMDHMVIADSTGKAAANGPAMWEARKNQALEQGMASLVQPTLSRWFTEPYRTRHPDMVGPVGTMIEATPVQGFAGCCDAIANIDTLAGLQGLRIPALVMVGAQDMATPPAMSEQIQQHWPDARLTMLDDAAHLSNIEQAQKFNQAVMAFLPH